MICPPNGKPTINYDPAPILSIEPACVSSAGSPTTRRKTAFLSEFERQKYSACLTDPEDHSIFGRAYVPRKSWIERHPVIFSVGIIIIGLVIGLTIGAWSR